MMRRSKLALPVGLLLAGCGVADPSGHPKVLEVKLMMTV